jgi:hypothetical protein
LPETHSGAQRASSRRIRSLLTGVLAALLVATFLTASAPDAHAASRKVVIVVGPVGSATKNYKDSARALASQARNYGANVVTVYSPYATWRRVKAAAAGANLLIYLGHGNGWPSTHVPYSATTKNGFGLNATYGNGNSNTKYYGEYYMQRLQLAPGAIVVLNRLCYASGNNEWGLGNPTKSTAKKRVDNYGYGFLAAGAKGVYASGITRVGYVLKALFTGNQDWTLAKVFWTDPARTRTYRFAFDSTRTPGARALMDPYAPGRYYRSAIGFLGTTVGDWRSS